VVIHLIGDDAFAKFLDEQSLDFSEQLIFGWQLGIVWPFDTKEYFRRHFPKSAKFLLGDYDQLLRDYTRAIKRNPKDSHAYRKLGDYYLDLGSCQLFNRRPREAIAAVLKALELDPDNATMINTVLATGYLFDNQFEKAKTVYLENKAAGIRDRSFSEVVLDHFK